MTGVPFGDFRAHLAPIRAEIDAALARVLESGHFILGREGEAFERELGAQMGCRDVVGVANGTEAIQLALEALGVGAGDEVVTSALSAAFTALAIERAGARPVFADLDPRTLNVSAESLERVLTPRTKALLPVHLYGHPADLDPILDLARRRGLHVVEDACQAHGALYKGRTVGTLAPLGTHSYYPTKNLGALGDGGAVLVNEAALATPLRRLRNGGQSDRYRHELVGMNSRLDELQAAILRVKLRHLAAWTDRRRAIAARYTAGLAGIGLGLPEEQPYARAVYHLYVVRHPKRDALLAALEQRGVGTLIHYPIPLHLQPAFARHGGRPGQHPAAEAAAREILSLPIYPELGDAQVDSVIAAVGEALRSLPGVNLVGPVPAALAGAVLFFVPGLVFLALVSRRDREGLRFDEALYLAVAVSVMASAWVALTLAEAGRFSLVLASALIALAGALALLFGRRRSGPPLPRLRGSRDILPALVVLGVAFSLQARPGEYLFGGRDPGTYVAAMGVIARTGGIVYTDPAVLSIPAQDVELFYRNPAGGDFSWGRFMGFPLERPESGRVFPEFFHLFPAFGAYLFAAMGVKGALATPPLFGILGTLGAFFALRRLFGEAPALLGGLLLAVNVVQVWFARTPVSEPVSQFLVFVAFLALAHWEERGGAAFGALFGAALGLSLLVRIDGVLLLVPLALYLLVRRAHGKLGWAQAAAALVPLGLLAGHAAFHAAFWARKYLVSIATRPYWQQPLVAWVGLGLAVVVLVVAAERFGPRLVRRLEAHGEALRAGALLAILLLSSYAYFLRPLFSAWAGGDGNDAALKWPEPGLLARLSFAHLAAHDAQSFVRLGWFVTPLGLLLGVLGLLLAIRAWKPRYLFPLSTLVAFALFYFYKIRIYNDYYFALRRFVPVILPLGLGLAAFALCALSARGGRRRVLAGLLAALLFGLSLADTRRIAGFVDWRGAVRFVDDVARRFGPDDVVIFEQAQSIHLLSLPLWAVHGVRVLELARFNPDPDKLRHLVAAWRDRYRNIYFVHTYRTDLCGLFLEHVEDHAFGSFEWERAYGRPPERPEFRALRFRVSRVVPPEELKVPPLGEVDVGGSDAFQVSGFFDKEGGGEHSFRWTGSCASVYVPGARGGDRLVVTASAGHRPDVTPVAVSLSGVPLGSFVPGSDWAEASFALPEVLPAGPPVLRFDVPAWRPINVLPGSSDSRDLGVMLDRIQLLRGASR